MRIDHPHDVDDEFGSDPPRSVPDDQGLSLDELSESFARLLSEGVEPYEPTLTEEPSDGPANPIDGAAEEVGIGAAPGLEADDACPVTPRSILEAILFVGHPGNEPITSQQVAHLMRGVRPAEIDDLVQELNATYESEGCPYVIQSIGAGYAMTLREQYDPLREKFHGRIREARLSQAAIDVLAIVAYNQPILRGEVDRLRGKASGAILSQLVRRQLLRVDRREGKRRTPVYATTPRFLELFGLERIDDLPRGQELDAG